MKKTILLIMLLICIFTYNPQYKKRKPKTPEKIKLEFINGELVKTKKILYLYMEMNIKKQREKIRAPFYNELKKILKINNIREKQMADWMDISSQEFYNLFRGHQNSVPSAGIYDMETVYQLCNKFLIENNLKPINL